MSGAWWWALTAFTLAACWFCLWLLRAWEAWSLERSKRTLGADPDIVPAPAPAPEPATATPFVDSVLAPAAEVDPGAAVSPGLARLLQPVTPLELVQVDPLQAELQPALSGAVITPKAIEAANSSIIHRCEQDGMVATPLACYLLGFYKAVEDLRKPPGYVVHVSMGLNPEIVAVFPQDPQEKK